MGLLYWTGGKTQQLPPSRRLQNARPQRQFRVFIRIPIEPREEWMPVHYGYEVQHDNEPEKSNEDDYTSPARSTRSPSRWRSPANPAPSGTPWSSH